MDDASIEEEFEHGRQLCPDDGCIGVISAEGLCQVCGAIGEDKVSAETETLLVPRMKRHSSQGVDLVHRALCPDGSCIGVIGPDGRCKECGHVTDSIIMDPRLRGLNLDESELEKATFSTRIETPSPETHIPSPETSPDAPQAVQDSESDSFEARVLCPDGACIGLIGSSGSCQECGHLL